MANNAKIAQQKEKDFDDVVPRDGFCDMPEELQETVVGAAREACKKHHDGELKYYKTMAIYVKEQLDKKLGGSYHICVGKLQFLNRQRNLKTNYKLLSKQWFLFYLGTNFGSYVTY